MSPHRQSSFSWPLHCYHPLHQLSWSRLLVQRLLKQSAPSPKIAVAGCAIEDSTALWAGLEGFDQAVNLCAPIRILWIWSTDRKLRFFPPFTCQKIWEAPSDKIHSSSVADPCSCPRGNVEGKSVRLSDNVGLRRLRSKFSGKFECRRNPWS